MLNMSYHQLGIKNGNNGNFFFGWEHTAQHKPSHKIKLLPFLQLDCCTEETDIDRCMLISSFRGAGMKTLFAFDRAKVAVSV